MTKRSWQHVGLAIGGTWHVALAVAMTAMAAPLLPAIPEQLASGYVPPGYEVFVLLVAAPFALAGLVLAATLHWLATTRRRWILLCDLLMTVLAWTAFLPFLFVTLLPFVLGIAAPLGILLVAVIPPSTTSARPADIAGS